eukprot:9403659-Heterocapsa_arctica.AAC.1
MAAITTAALRLGPWSLAIHARAAGRGRAQGSTPSAVLSFLEPVLILHPSFRAGWDRERETMQDIET